MDTILQAVSRRMAHNSSPSSSDVMKYSPTDSLKMNARDNKRIERRKPNWTESENVFLLDQFAMHREILTCKATDASTNLRKQEIWRLICANLNQNNTLVRRTPAEVRRKWKNLVTAAKKEVWEMRHQIHISGGSGTNGRKISELSQRVLQLHSSGNINNQSNGIYGSLLSAGLLGNAGGGGGDKFGSKYADYMEDKSFIPAHFTPIITLSESNNNHIISGSHAGDGPPSPMMSDDDEEDQESSDSRNATEFMSDSGVNEQEGMDLRVNITSARNSYASSNSRSARSHLSAVVGLGGGGNHLSHHLRENLLRGAVDLGDDDEELLEDDEEVELAMAAEKRYANYNGQLTNGGTITRREQHHLNNNHGHNAAATALANFHHAASTNGPTSAAAAAAAASVLLERQHLQHLQQLATAASLRPALNTSNNSSSSSSHNNNNNNSNSNNNNNNGNTHHHHHNQSGQGSEDNNASSTTNLNRKCSESTEEISQNGGGGGGGGGGGSGSSNNNIGGGGGVGGNGDILSSIRSAANSNATSNFFKLKNHFAAALQESDLLSNLYRERLQLQIEVLKLRKEKLSQELNTPNGTGTGGNGIRRPKFVRCGLRLLRGGRNNNLIGSSASQLHRTNLYRARMAALNRLKHHHSNNTQLNGELVNGNVGGGGGSGNSGTGSSEAKRKKVEEVNDDGDDLLDDDEDEEGMDREISDDVDEDDDEDLDNMNDIHNVMESNRQSDENVVVSISKQESGISSSSSIKKESEGKCAKLVNGDSSAGGGGGVTAETKMEEVEESAA